MATEYRIVGTLDPAGVTAGSQKVKQELRGVDTAAASTKRAINTAFDQTAFDRTIGTLVTRLEQVDKSLGEVSRSSAAINTSNRQLIGSLDGLTAAAGKTSSSLGGVANEERDVVRGASQMDAALRRVLQAVDAEALALQRMNELLADAKRLHDAGKISAEQFARVQKMGADMANNVTTATGAQRMGMQQLGYQLGDVATMYSLGARPAQIFGSQIGQITQAVQLMAGGTSKFAAFLGGPWGIALSVGAILAAPFIGKLLEGNSALDDAVDKLRKDAKETAITGQAKAVFARSMEGLTAAINDNRKALDQLNDSGKTAARVALENALNTLENAKAKRAETAALLDNAEALLSAQRTRAMGPGERGDLAAMGLSRRQAEVDRLRGLLGQTDKIIGDAQSQVTEALGRRVVERAEQMADPLQRIKEKYEGRNGLIDLARRQATAEEVRNGTLSRQILLLKERQRVETETAQRAASDARSDARNGPLTDFITPTTGRISSGFGARAAPTKGASTFHRGIDIAAPIGTPVKAAAGGVIIHAGKLGGLGNAIIVDHGGGTITEYGHLSSVLVQRGQRVGQGDQIGAVGNTGISTGPHLDYRVKVGGRYVDPRKGRFRTDETATAARAARTEETAAEKAARKAEQERDFVTGVEDTAATRGQDGRANTLQAQIARTIADFKKRFDREANPDETRRITKALTDADARETAVRFDQAYVQPLNRLQALQGKVGVDRQVMNAQLEETARLGRDLTPVEAQMIENSIRQSDALNRQQSILESVKQPVQDYRDQIAALNALLAQGTISQEQFNARVGALGTTASQFKANLPGNDSLGRSFADQAQREAADQERTQALADLQTYLDQGTILTSEAFAIREAIERRHNETLRNIDRARNEAALSSAQSTTESLLSIAEDSVGKQSAVYKGLFVASKAFAIADSVIKIQQGIANALSLPFPANLAAVATVAAQAASIVSNIQSISLNLADGGPVRRQGGQGLLRGPGGARGDAIPVNGSDGEFMVNAAAVRRGGNYQLLEAINSGSVTAGLRSASNDNALARAGGVGGGGDTYSMSFGDVVVNPPQGMSAGDGRAIGRDVKAALSELVDERIANAKRAGGALTKTRSSVMNG